MSKKLNRMSLSKAWRDRFRRAVYSTSTVLDVKIDVHKHYSSKPIDLVGQSVERLGLRGHEDVLDVGCGTGHFLSYLRMARGHRGKLVGIDLARGVFAETLERSRQDYLSLRLLECDGQYLSFRTRSFDVVTAFHMLSHLPDPDQALTEMRRVLKRRGRFIATTNSLESYPHVAKYRRKAFGLMGWGEPLFTTSFFNSENIASVLARTWPRVAVTSVSGELTMPTEVFLNYFNANMDIWEPRPTPEERVYILDHVREWLQPDLADGCIIEPKYVAFAVCSKNTESSRFKNSTTGSKVAGKCLGAWQ